MISHRWRLLSVLGVVLACGGVATVVLLSNTRHTVPAAARLSATPSQSSSTVRSGADGRVDPSTLPSASSEGGAPLVGPLFKDGLTHDHTCTASVVASATGDTILTAAHCLSGSARGIEFVPDYQRGAAPYGVWNVTGAYFTHDWLAHQTPADDFAVLTVASRTVDGKTRTLASVTGAERVSTTPAVRTPVTVIAYNDGRDDESTSCTVPLVMRGGHPTFYCHGFVGGSSGSPWFLAADRTSDPTVVGLIGGRHQGGCVEFTSHSALFTSTVADLVVRAAKGGRSDTAPAAGSDNCPTTSN